MAFNELIKKLTDEIGIDESAATLGIDKTMAIIKVIGGQELFVKIADSIKGSKQAGDAGSIASSFEDDGVGGQLEQIGSMSPSEIGGSRGRAQGLGSALATSGMHVEKMDDFAAAFVDFIRNKAGSDVADSLLEKVPMLTGMAK